MFRRRKSSPPGAMHAGEGREHCPMCGEAVPVGDDGRCDLGHRVRPTHNVEPADLVLGAGAFAAMAADSSGGDVRQMADQMPDQGTGGLAGLGDDDLGLDGLGLDNDPGLDDDLDDLGHLDGGRADLDPDRDAAGDGTEDDVGLGGELDWE